MATSRELISAEQVKKNAFDHALHGGSGKTQGGIRSMMGKDNAAHIYNLATDLYEYAWGASFHFCRFAYGEAFSRAIARHEHYLAHNVGLKGGMKVLDVGCGVGGPAREMVKFTGCHVTGLNINQYQVQRATNCAAKEGLSHKLDFVQGDFMNIPFPDNSFDAVYAIEATVHAPSLEGVYKEIFRVLKPGGVFGVYEWLMTEEFNNDDLEHRRIRLHIEEGDGIAQMFKISDGLAAIKAAGFDLELHHDLAADDDGPAPWYWPLDSDLRYAQTLWDALTVLRMNKWGRVVAHNFFSVLETVRVIPAGTRKTAESLGKFVCLLFVLYLTPWRQGRSHPCGRPPEGYVAWRAVSFSYI
ncbi:hypothetical protein COL922a_013715 [Colletotrichum nupharicola]|nr:hypothetical protein COL922a_013715 [Colletotrichum nupharicola]